MENEIPSLGDSFLKSLNSSEKFGIYIYTKNGQIAYANKAFCNMTGYSEYELLNNIKLSDILEGVNKQEAVQNMDRRIKGEHFLCEYKEVFYKTKNGSIKPLINFAYTISFDNQPAGLVMVFDITHRKIFEEFYQILSDINQLIVRVENEEELLNKVCDILYNYAEFQLVVLGEIDKSTKLFKPKIILGKENHKKHFKQITVSVDETLPEGQGTVGRAYRSKKIAVSDNIFKDNGMSVWRNHQKALGVYAACSIPLFKKDKIEYILILYSNTTDIFSDKYLSLIKQIQIDISFALEKIEKDKELKILDNAFSVSTDWVLVTDNKGTIIKVNKAVETISGYTAAELTGKNPSIFKSNYHSSDFYKKMYDSITKGKQCKCVFTNRKKDGSFFYLDSVIVPITANGKIERYVNIARDITKRIELNRQVEKISNIYKMLYSINQLIIKTDNEDEIFEKLPNLMIDILGATLSFTAVVKDNEIVNIVSHDTKNGNYKQFLDFFEHKIKTAPCSQALPLIKSIKKGHIYIENNILSNALLKPFHKQIELYNLNSCFSMPISKNNKTAAVLVGLSEQKNFFDKDIHKLLKQIQYDISAHMNKLETEKWYEIFANAISSGFDFIAVTDKDFNIVYINNNTVKFLGYNKEDLIGKHHSIFSSKIYSRDFVRNFYSTLLSGKTYSGVMTYKTKDSRFVKALVNITPYKSKDNKKYYIAMGRDISESLELQKIIEENLNKDPLTGLTTRTSFLSSLKEFIKRAEYENLFGAVAVINPIRFSMINHAYGFETGNKILLQITERLKNYLRKYDVISKLESDKFGIIIKDIKNEEDIYTILVTLIDNLSKPYIVEGSTIYISFNTGISIFPKDAKNAETLMEKAEIALLDVKNKEEGLGFYKEDLKIKAKKRLKLKTAMSSALKNKEFILYYQPYFDIKTNKIAGAEALIRWKKHNKIIPPMEFIPFLEESGTISEVEEWLIEEISKKQAEWKNSYAVSIPISINISPTSFEKHDFADKFISNTKLLNLDPNLINIEIIERLFIEDIENSQSALDELKKYGFRLSIDDFGTGYSSLSYLSSLPIDYIKIDISFIRKMLYDNNTKAVVKTVIALAKDINMKTIAEGVEKKEQFELLKEFGCDFIQGYLFSKPLPENEFEELLKKEIKSNQ